MKHLLNQWHHLVDQPGGGSVFWFELPLMPSIP